ncbi:GntR family transcriptional regulator [Plantactinospora endophytica]|uniref:GntR family transcriptional regulator n=2 Tax=Plantactinospora endophytica TaxID=673535 RepID=A0ABQ4E6X3_9ACTN|nr:GntR family transcriptional regulator [Plantactinospora endophytica]
MAWWLSIRVDRLRGGPLTVQIHDAIRRDVVEGVLHPGARLPSSRQLATDLGVSRSVVVEAYDRLIAEGYLDAVRGSGTRVARHLPQAPTVSPPPDIPTDPPLDGGVRLDLRPCAGIGVDFPHRDWLTAYQRAVRAVGRTDLDRPLLVGAPGLRAELASYLGRTAGARVEPAGTVVTAGYPAALRLLATALRRLGHGTVAVEDPCDPWHRRILAGAGLRTYALPVDRYGADARALAGSDVRAVLVNPGHHFPTGVTMSEERRARLLRWAQETDGWVIELDRDGDLWLETGRRPLALQRADPLRVAYAGTASGVLGPSLRLGWMCVPPGLLPAVRQVGAEWDFAADNLTQLAFAEFLGSGLFDRHTRRTRDRWRARRTALRQAVHRHLPQARLLGTAGPNVYLRLPGHVDEASLVTAARWRGVSVLGARHFAFRRPPEAPALVVGYAGLPRSGLFEAMRAIEEALREQPGAAPLRRTA